MLTVMCVLKSGGDTYDKTWVAKLKRAVERNLTIPHTFACLSDVPVPCNRIPLKHAWPGWWSKIELFRPGVINGPTIYMDLDTVIVGNFDYMANNRSRFAMLRNFSAAPQHKMVGSGVMWFRDEASVPHKVYEKFAKMPECYMEHHLRHADAATSYIGDQAFIWDALGGKIDALEYPGILSYKRHCRKLLPKDSSIVCFHGRPRPSDVSEAWVAQHWN